LLLGYLARPVSLEPDLLMRLNAPLLTFLAIHPPEARPVHMSEIAKNLIIYKSFMIVGVWFVDHTEVIWMLAYRD